MDLVGTTSSSLHRGQPKGTLAAKMRKVFDDLGCDIEKARSIVAIVEYLSGRSF